MRAARDVHRRPGGHHPLRVGQRPERRPQRRRGAPRARRAADRRAVPVQLEEGRADAAEAAEGEPTMRRWSCSRDAHRRTPRKDIKLNLQAVLQPGSLTPEQRWGVAVACAVASRNARAAGGGDRRRAGAEVGPAVVEDAMRGGGAHGDEQRLLPVPPHGRASRRTATQPARLRMNRLGKPPTQQGRLRALLARGQRDQRLRDVHAGAREGGARGRADRGPGARRGPDRRHRARRGGGAGDARHDLRHSGGGVTTGGYMATKTESAITYRSPSRLPAADRAEIVQALLARLADGLDL